MKKQFIFILISIFLISFVSAQGISYCCEKTVDGAWCQDAAPEKCDKDFRRIPSSCEATSYCKLGCCYDSQEGTCMRNSPEIVCNDEGGVYSQDSASCDIPQCQLGCCLMGDQAAFVTQTRCKHLSALYGLETNFRTDISSEVECIASATSEMKGACVFEEEYEKTCLFITKRECIEMGADSVSSGNESSGSNVEFHEDYLCSDEKLGTNCGPTEQTKCVEGRDEVYFVDSCGNLANIYDASKIKNKNYWSRILEKDESCNPSSSNADSPTCGNCDYYLGSTCKTYKRGEDKVKPNYGDYICRDLSCEHNGKEYQHGETWCANSEGTSKITAGSYGTINIKENLPGSRYFRLVCYNGEVSIEPCADFRAEVCLQSEVNGFRTAACKVNKWQDCYYQNSSHDCENRDKRDCAWVKAGSIAGCGPLYTPGFDFWNSEGEAESLCSMINHVCVVKFDDPLIGDKDCVENCECLKDSYRVRMNDVCTAIGDCGLKTNYLGVVGYYDENADYEDMGEEDDDDDEDTGEKEEEEKEEE